MLWYINVIVEGENETMHKINVIYELEPEYLKENQPHEYQLKVNNEKGKNVRVSDKVFDLMKDEGLIKKTPYGYVFIGKYEKPEKKKPK